MNSSPSPQPDQTTHRTPDYGQKHQEHDVEASMHDIEHMVSASFPTPAAIGGWRGGEEGRASFSPPIAATATSPPARSSGREDVAIAAVVDEGCSLPSRRIWRKGCTAAAPVAIGGHRCHHRWRPLPPLQPDLAEGIVWPPPPPRERET